MRNAKAFAARIRELRRLRVKDIKKFNETKKEIMKEYEISQATLYRHLAKRIPGKHKTRSDAGKERKPVSRKARALVTEMRLSGVKKGKALRKAEEMTGEKISTVKAVKIEKGIEVDKSNFGSAAKEFIRKILELDMMSPDAGIYFRYKGTAFKLTRDYIEDIALVLATAYNDSLESGTDAGRLQIDREQKMKSQLYQLVQEALRVASEQFDNYTGYLE
jgi:hypothetical protein